MLQHVMSNLKISGLTGTVSEYPMYPIP